jgi:hypothetical protein
MNTCIKCGCDDAYPSLPPCPTPVDCPNPQPCAEFFNAQCVRYTLPDIMCGLNIVVAQDSSIADALESIVLFFCTNFSNSVQSVTGLNTDNTDPLNPIVKISVDGITITGLGTPASPLIAVGGVDGSGITDYIARWTPDATTLGTGLIRDNGTNVGINIAPGTIAKVTVANTTVEYTVDITNGNTGIGAKAGIRSITSGVNGTGFNTGATFTARNNTLFNIGVVGESDGVSTKNIGGFFSAIGGTNNYSIRLQDTTEAAGRFLKSITANGEANWADITAADITGGIDGSGIADYIARWSDANTLTTGLIKDDGTNTSIGGALDVTHKLLVLNSTIANTITAYNSYIGTGNQLAINAQSFGAGTGRNIAVQGFATTNTVLNVGVKGITSGASAVNLGGWFAASGATNNYSLRLTDGTEGVGKVLTCMTATGEANWVTPSGGSGLTWSTITGNNPTATLAANNGYVIKNTIGGGTTDLTLPSSGVVVGDIIKISATKAGGGGFLQTWRILEGSTADIIFYSFYDITSDSEITGLKNTSPLLTFDDNVSGSYTVFKNQSLTLTCVEDLGTGYAWNLELANGKVIS